jgi:hypothetical protein
MKIEFCCKMAICNTNKRYGDNVKIDVGGKGL